jgi:hypothetical protein
MSKQEKNSYLYLGIHYDLFNDREVGINDIKIGITNTPDTREYQLNKTHSPIGYMFVKLYKFYNETSARIVEKQILHNLLYSNNTRGEWFLNDDESIPSRIGQFIQALRDLGVKVEEVTLENEKLSNNKKEVIKKNNSTRNYFNISNVEKATETDEQYSLWILKTPTGETYPMVYNINTTRANGRKATPKTAANYCNSEKFLELVEFDYTKLTAEFVMGSSNKEEIDNKKLELKS